MKTCSKCNQSKSFSEFAKRKDSKDGYRGTCIICTNKRTKQWELNNPSKRAKHRKKWRDKNIELARELTKNWHLENPYSRQEYYDNNKSKYRLWASNSRAIKRKSIPDFVIGCDIETKRIKDTYELCTRMTKATGIEHHVDHMIPLSKGGWHWSANLQIITAHENVTKSAKVNPDVKKTIEEMYNNATRRNGS